MRQLRRHCNMRPPDVAPVLLGCFWPTLYRACAQTAISQTLIKILTSPLDSVTPISQERAIIWRLDDVFTLWPWLLTLRSNTLCQSWPKSNNLRLNYWKFCKLSPSLRHAVTLILDPLKTSSSVVHRVSHVQTMDRIWAKSNDPRLSYWQFGTLYPYKFNEGHLPPDGSPGCVRPF